MTKKAYTEYNPDLKAECIYLYYFTAAAKCQVYYLDYHRYIPPSTMPAEVASIVDRIKNGTLSTTYSGMDSLDRNRKSYFVVVLDEPPLKLISDDAVKFKLKPWYLFGGNHTFMDGHDIPAVAGYPDMSAFYCFNHMLHREGRVLKAGEKEWFKVKLNHTHERSWHYFLIGWWVLLLGLAWLLGMRSHEDTGANAGPPVPPPE
jgi:hypothetical protein